MKTDVIGVRLPVEQVAKLQKMANSRGMKVSDLVREMVKVGIEGAEASSDLTVQLLASMKQLEENLEGGQTWLADVVITQMKAVAAESAICGVFRYRANYRREYFAAAVSSRTSRVSYLRYGLV